MKQCRCNLDMPNRVLPMSQSTPSSSTAAGETIPFTDTAIPATAANTAFLPLLLTILAVAGWFAFQSVQLVMEQQQMSKALSALETQQANATKLRSALDSVATATAKLAAEGNSNAIVIVDELRKRGITINPAASAPLAE
jgi:hypothetical protein